MISKKNYHCRVSLRFGLLIKRKTNVERIISLYRLYRRGKRKRVIHFSLCFILHKINRFSFITIHSMANQRNNFSLHFTQLSSVLYRFKATPKTTTTKNNIFFWGESTFLFRICSFVQCFFVTNLFSFFLLYNFILYFIE